MELCGNAELLFFFPVFEFSQDFRVNIRIQDMKEFNMMGALQICLLFNYFFQNPLNDVNHTHSRQNRHSRKMALKYFMRGIEDQTCMYTLLVRGEIFNFIKRTR